MTDHIRTLSALSRFPIACIPNAGLPDEDGKYNETPEMLAGTIGRFVESGWVNVVGGCCGTGPDHIRLLVETVAGKTGHSPVDSHETRVSGIEALVVDQDTRPVIVGRAHQRPRQPPLPPVESTRVPLKKHPRWAAGRFGAARTCWTFACRTRTGMRWPTL